MAVQPVRAALLSPPPAPAPAAPASKPPEPADGFQASSPPEETDRLRQAARGLTRQGELKKGESRYQPTAWGRGQDGTLYIGYSEGWEGKRSYLAAVAPTGRIAWEAPLGEVQVEQVGTGPDGSVQVGTRDGHLVVSPEGRVTQERTGGPKIRSHHQDATGMHLEVLDENGTVRAWGPEGAERPLPAELQGLKSRWVQGTPDDGLLVFSDERLVQLAPGGASARAIPLPSWPSNETLAYLPHKAWVLEGGDVLVQRQSFLTLQLRGHRHFMRPGLGMGFGGNFDPDYYAPEVVTRNAFLRLGPDGTERWKTDELPERTRPVVVGDRLLLFEPGGSEVRTVTASGQVEKAFDAEGGVQDCRAGSRPGEVLVRHGSRVSRFGTDGQPRDGVPLEGERQGLALEGDLPDGRILFRDEARRTMWSWDPGTDGWTRLTDLEADHSVRAEDLVAPGPPEEARTVEQGDGWVLIGGIQLPRRS